MTHLWPPDRVCAYCGPRFHELVALIDGEWRCIDREDCAAARAAKGIREGSGFRFKEKVLP